MNSVNLIGRLSKDPDVRYTTSGTAVAKFTLAVDRKFKKDGQPSADFISCIAFGKTAEIIEKYFAKGKPIGVQGSIQTGSYEKNDGTKVYTTDVFVDTIEFMLQDKTQKKSDVPSGEIGVPSGFEEISDEEMPF